MISKHVDIWAVLVLLLGFALFTRTNETVVRVARAKLNLYHVIHPVEVRVSPFRPNDLRKTLPLRYVPAPCRQI
jgi:hypothetical protein